MSGGALSMLTDTALSDDASSAGGLGPRSSIPLSRAGSAPARHGGSPLRARPAATPAPLEWRRFLTVEERTNVRAKIKAAYAAQCTSYEDLLEAAVAIEEELLHMSAPSRLDYFKASVQFDRRGARVAVFFRRVARVAAPPSVTGRGPAAGCHVDSPRAGRRRERSSGDARGPSKASRGAATRPWGRRGGAATGDADNRARVRGRETVRRAQARPRETQAARRRRRPRAREPRGVEAAALGVAGELAARGARLAGRHARPHAGGVKEKN